MEEKEVIVEAEATPEIKMAAVVLITQEGQIQIQDAKPLFDTTVELPMEASVMNNVFKDVAKNIERQEIIQSVKQELAASFGGK